MKFLQRQKSDPVTSDLVNALQAIHEKLDNISEPQEELPTTSFAVVERMESLENRFEELRGMCLRHVQSASQRLKRAEEVSGERELNGDGPIEASPIPPMPEENGVHDEEISDLQWGVQQLRARGQSAVI